MQHSEEARLPRAGLGLAHRQRCEADCHGQERRDATAAARRLANQEKLLAAAVSAMLRHGRQVPMATIAAEAGVGVGTLSRRYATREALLDALSERSFQLVLDAATGPRSPRS